MTSPDPRPPHAIEPWSFSRTVMLRKSSRPSSVLLLTLAGATALVGVWGLLAPLPETIAVNGKLQPSQPVRAIEAPVSGVVEEVLVKEGQSVPAGAPLLRFDPREAQAKLQAATAIRERLSNEIAVYQAILGETSVGALSPNQRSQLSSQGQAVRGRNQAAREELARSQTRIAGLRQSLSTAESIAQRFRSLQSSGATSQLQLLEAQQRVDELRTDLEAEQRDAARLQASATATIEGNDADLRQRIEANLREIAQLTKQISEAQLQLSTIELRAPVAGVVFDLTVGNGSVVVGQQSKPLLKIVPQNNLEAKVYVPNSAIGFLYPGQNAQISLQAFPTHDYGRLPAKVLRIGSDALTPEEQVRVLGTQAAGLYFPATLQLERQTLGTGPRSVSLQAGMSLTADVHLRDRRFISVITGMLEDQRRGLERMR
jgi:hemolysin D